jgi:protein-S-isoprenylcysteine O-methyltransferase Ste14
MSASTWAAFSLIPFALGTLILATISRASLLRPRSHGFFRFFAWEAILLLLLLNVPVWTRNPSSWHQLISWFLLFGSLVPVILGTRELRNQGNPNSPGRREPGLYGFERTSNLVTTGIYRYIRHPLYSSLLLLAWGLFFKAPSGIGAVLALFATAALFGTARFDELECLSVFGSEYQEYMKRTRRFIPGVF